MAVSFVLDTSAYSAFNRGDGRLRSWIVPDSAITVPVIVVGELRAGFAVGSRTEENEALLQRFLDAPNVEVGLVSVSMSQRFADFFAQQRRAGRPVGSNDLWIAAMARELDLPVLTLDADFGRIAGVELVEV